MRRRLRSADSRRWGDILARCLFGPLISRREWASVVHWLCEDGSPMLTEDGLEILGGIGPGE